MRCFRISAKESLRFAFLNGSSSWKCIFWKPFIDFRLRLFLWSCVVKTSQRRGGTVGIMTEFGATGENGSLWKLSPGLKKFAVRTLKMGLRLRRGGSLSRYGPAVTRLCWCPLKMGPRRYDAQFSAVRRALFEPFVPIERTAGPAYRLLLRECAGALRPDHGVESGPEITRAASEAALKVIPFPASACERVWSRFQAR